MSVNFNLSAVGIFPSDCYTNVVYFINPSYSKETRAALIQEAIRLFEADPQANFNSVAKLIRVDPVTLKAWLKKHDPILARKYELRQIIDIPLETMQDLFEKIVRQEISADDAMKALGISGPTFYRLLQKYDLHIGKTRKARGIRKPSQRRHGIDFYRALIDEITQPGSGGVARVLKKHGVANSTFKLNLHQLGLQDEYRQKMYLVKPGTIHLKKPPLPLEKQKRKQRLDVLLEFLYEHPSPISVKDYMELCKTSRAVSYGDLVVFEKQGLIKEIPIRGAEAHYHLTTYLDKILSVDDLLEMQTDYNINPKFDSQIYNVSDLVHGYFLDGALPLSISQYSRLLNLDFHKTSDAFKLAVSQGRAKVVEGDNRSSFYQASNYVFDSIKQLRKANFMQYLQKGGSPATVQQYREINATYKGAHHAAAELAELVEEGQVAKYPGRKQFPMYGLPGRDYQKEEYADIPARRSDTQERDDQLLSYLRVEGQPITAADYCKMFNVPESSAQYTLMQLVKANKLSSFGNTPVYYHLPQIAQKKQQELLAHDAALTLGSEVLGRPNNTDTCYLPGCDGSNTTDQAARGLCAYHYGRAKYKIHQGLATQEDLLKRGIFRKSRIRKKKSPSLVKYSLEQRRKAIQLCRETTMSYAQISKRVRVPSLTLRLWCLKEGARTKKPAGGQSGKKGLQTKEKIPPKKQVPSKKPVKIPKKQPPPKKPGRLPKKAVRKRGRPLSARMKRITAKIKEKIVELCKDSTISQQTIGNWFGLSPGEVSRICRKAGISRPRGRKGPARSSSLSGEQRAQIVELCKDFTIPQKEIANWFGLLQSEVSTICRQAGILRGRTKDED